MLSNYRSSRRFFIGGAAAFAAAAAVGAQTKTGGDAKARTGGDGKRRWYKGNLHMHTFWSDGRAFPEEAVNWYKSRGYNFVGLSDHNIFQNNPNRWIQVTGSNRRYFDAYVKSFPDAVTRVGANGKKEAKLSTFDELSKRFNVPGEFLMIPDVEATRGVQYSDGRSHQLHMNYVNVPELLPSYTAKGFRRTVRDRPLGEFLAEHARETSACAKKLGRKSLLIVNHPIWMWYDVGPEVLIEVPEVRFFEACNNGALHNPAAGLPDDGFDTDRLWDVVNAFRARRGQPLLYGIGTDDTHFYYGEGGKMLMPGNAWSLVRAESLDASSLISAMEKGDFVTCEGIEPEDVRFDAQTGRLDVSIGAAAQPRTIRFIVSKRDFSEKPVAKKTVRPAGHNHKSLERNIAVYDDKVGCVVKTVEVAPGKAMQASYTLAKDDLYVRARIEEKGKTLCTAPLHPRGVHVAWTQPYSRS